MNKLLIPNPNTEQSQIEAKPYLQRLVLLIVLIGIKQLAGQVSRIIKAVSGKARTIQAVIPIATAAAESPKYLTFAPTTAQHSPQIAQRYS